MNKIFAYIIMLLGGILGIYIGFVLLYIGGMTQIAIASNITLKILGYVRMSSCWIGMLIFIIAQIIGYIILSKE